MLRLIFVMLFILGSQTITVHYASAQSAGSEIPFQIDTVTVPDEDANEIVDAVATIASCTCALFTSGVGGWIAFGAIEAAASQIQFTREECIFQETFHCIAFDEQTLSQWAMDTQDNGDGTSTIPPDDQPVDSVTYIDSEGNTQTSVMIVMGVTVTSVTPR